jgi:small-conductance mechanosensitive channel
MGPACFITCDYDSVEERRMDLEALETHNTSKRICIMAGIALLVLGIIFSLWLILLINSFFRDPDRVTLIGKMLRLGSEEQHIQGQLFTNDFSITYSNFLSYFVLLIICGILLTSAGRIVAAFLSSGIDALSIAAGVARGRRSGG